MKIDRYNSTTGGMEEHPEGEYVDAYEYDALAAKLEVSEAASRAAVSKAEWQARTNHEMNESQSRIRQLEAAIRWVLNDAKYKAPEQVDSFMVGRWFSRLNMVLTTPAETKGDASGN
jgi:hypothetical protein